MNYIALVTILMSLTGGSGSGIRSKKRKLNTKEREEKLVKQNLKLLRVLEPPKSTSFKKQKRQEKEGTSGNSKLEKSAFSEEDFKKFEAEYFVTQ